ncbi:hypothetical protein OF83DRAFT_1236985 [Amylostereum chailletii]|nr:hypothetical protein OF83DRAFT_1236985 [Amylostereum chailletii]
MLSKAQTLMTVVHGGIWLIFLFTLGCSCVLLLSQAVRTSSRRSWKNNIDVLIIGIAYGLVLVLSIAVCLKRRISTFRRLQRIIKGNSTLDRDEVPKSVHEFIEQEYARSAVIAYESVPKETHQEGWGRPHTRYSGIQFRRVLLDTVPEMDTLTRFLIPSLPHLRSNDRMLHHFRFIAPLIPKDNEGLSSLHYYDSAIQLARYSDREPSEREFQIGMAAAMHIKRILYECRLEMLEGSRTDVDRPIPQTVDAAS